MLNELKIRNRNVRQINILTGQVNDQVAMVDAIVSEAVNQPTAEEKAKQERMVVLEVLHITTKTEVVPETYSLTVDGVGIFALGDIHSVKGKQKSGKSAVLKVCMSALLKGRQFRVKCELIAPVVLFIDTEQQATDVKLIIEEVKYLTGCEDDYIDSHLKLYTMRRMNYDTLIGDTRLLIEQYRPQVDFIDGIVDYVASFNDEVLSRNLIHELLILCDEFHCAIINVLHENKSIDDENMRGHLGSVLAQKEGTGLQCKKNNRGIISVSCPDARHGTMPQWNIYFNAEGHIASADELWTIQQQAESEKRNSQRKQKRDDFVQQRLDIAIDIINKNGGEIKRGLLINSMMERLKLTRTPVSKFIKKMVEEKRLFEVGDDRSISAKPNDGISR